MSANCATAIGVLVDAVEYGAKPWPVFFADLGCGSGQWPPQGEDLENIVLNTPFSLRQAACNQAPGVPAEVLSTTANNTIPVQTCPLPMIQSAIIPPGFKITFYAVNPGAAAQPPFQPLPGNTITVDPGVFVLHSTDTIVDPNNLLILNESSNTPYLWGSSQLGTPGSGVCSAGNTNYPVADEGPWFDKNRSGCHNSSENGCWPNTTSGEASQALMNLFDGDGKQRMSYCSCGAPFWPSLTSVLRNNDLYGTPQLDSSGSNFVLLKRGVDDFLDGAFCYSTGYFDHGATTGAQNGYALGHYYDGRNTCKPGGPTYTTGDCVGSLGAFEVGLKPQYGDVNINGCGCNQDSEPVDPKCALGQACQCPTTMQGNGSVDQVKIELTDGGSWELQQFQYCIGLKSFTLGGLPIQRYGNSTVACDPIVTSLCQNTAFVASNPQYAKACSCVLEQQRFNIQFAGLNLPVQCFSTACADNDPNVYRTIDQSAQCSARLCSQIITINGSAIAAEGYQTMLCDGQTYVVNTSTNVSPGPVPTIPLTSPSNIQLGPTFYIALGLLGIMILLLAAWGIRKWVISKRQQQQRRKDILHSLERLASSAPPLS